MEKKQSKHPGGRPLKFATPELLKAKIDAYFADCDEHTDSDGNPTKPYTVAGLALWLNVDRLTLINYEKRDEFFNTIKNAKLKIEQQLEEKLHGSAVTGLIFNLKNNFGWKDKIEKDVNLNISPADELARLKELADESEAE